MVAEDTQVEENAKSEEEMFAEWENMAEGEGDDGVGEQILDQGEIDSLLGVDGDDNKPKGGNRLLLETTVVNYEKLPMLNQIFDKFERFLSTALRHFTADNVDVTLAGSTSVRYGDYLDSIPLPAGLVVVRAEGLDDFILLVYESQLIYAVVDILLGGRKSRPARIEGRNFTNIERKIMENLTEVVLTELSNAFEVVAPISFSMERMEVNPRFAVITREVNAANLVSVRINLEGREGLMHFCMPYATLEPIRDKLLQQFMGEKQGQDNIWEVHLAQELFHTGMKMNAVLDEMTLPLSEVMEWRVGDTIALNAKSSSPIKMDCDGVTKLVGNIGKADENIAIQVAKTVSDINEEKQES